MKKVYCIVLVLLTQFVYAQQDVLKSSLADQGTSLKPVQPASVPAAVAVQVVPPPFPQPLVLAQATQPPQVASKTNVQSAAQPPVFPSVQQAVQSPVVPAIKSVVQTPVVPSLQQSAPLPVVPSVQSAPLVSAPQAAPVIQQSPVLASTQQLASSAPLQAQSVSSRALSQAAATPTLQSRAPEAPMQLRPTPSAPMQSAQALGAPSSSTSPVASLASPAVAAPIRAPLSSFIAPPAAQDKKIRFSKRKAKENEIDFSFDNQELSEMVKRYAEKKKLNVIFPPLPIKEKITFKPAHLLTLDEAKKYLYLFLDYAGYTILPGQDFVIVAKTDTGAAQRSRLPLYIFDPDSKLTPENLPDNDEYIRVIYYLANLKVENDPKSTVFGVLRDALTKPDNVFVDAELNGVIITDRARIVRSVLQLLRELDTAGAQIVLTTVQLYNANAGFVADLIKNQLLAANAGRGAPMWGGEPDKPAFAGQGSYFATSTRVVADTRRNMIIILGKEAPVNRLKEFIRETLDAPLEAGKSIFHVYDLKYLDAELFEPVLSAVVQSRGIGGDSQVMGQQVGGATRFFEGVVIKAEKPEVAAEAQKGVGDTGTTFGDSTASAPTPGQVYKGANRLLIAAQPADWIQIKKLIDQLDIPQRQVILEVLIVDYIRDRGKALKSQIRNPQRFNLKNGVGFQTANMDNNILPSQNLAGRNICGGDNCPLGTTITGDLLRLLTGQEGFGPSLISSQDPGSLIFSFNDPANTGIWGVVSLLNQIGHTRVLSRPHLIVLNNQQAKIVSSEIRRGFGSGSGTTGGVIVANVEDFTATLQVGLTPRIASKDRLNLEISIVIQQFGSGFDRSNRTIQTNVNMNSPNQVLVLGGLSETRETDNVTEVPILGKIPLIGWLFRSTEKVTTETELGVFIRPTIVEPKIREPMFNYTREKIRVGTEQVFDKSENLGNQQDPIIRFFFGKGDNEATVIKDYLAETKNTDLLEDKKKQPLQLSLGQE